MAKLIHILAASVGGGLVLGASIRIGESIGASARKALKERVNGAPERDESAAPLLSERLNRLEEKMHANSARTVTGPGPEWQAILAGVVARIDHQQSDFEAIRRQVGNVARGLDSVGAIADSLRSDLHRQLSDDMDQRLAAIEEKLQTTMKTANRDTVNAMVASIETRVAPRISRLEKEIGGQSTALAELRECSLQSERSVLRLLTVLERTVAPKSREAESESGQRMASDQAGGVDLSRPDPGKLSVVSGRGQDESGGGSGTVRRPASFR